MSTCGYDAPVAIPSHLFAFHSFFLFMSLFFLPAFAFSLTLISMCSHSVAVPSELELSVMVDLQSADASCLWPVQSSVFMTPMSG